MDDDNKIELLAPAGANLERRRIEPVNAYEVLDAEKGTDLRASWQVIRKRQWTIISMLLAIFTVALIATVKQKPVYRAQALVEIEKENPNLLSVQELFQLDSVSDTFLETQYKIMQSDTLAGRVSEQMRLDHRNEFNGPPAWKFWRDRAASVEFPTDPAHEQAVLERFKDRLAIDPVRRSRLVQVSFDSEDPQLAAKVVNALTDAYIQGNLNTRWEATQRASEWLSQQLEGVKIKLEKSEDELHQYAQSRGLLFLETETGTSQNIVDARLRQLQDELTKAQADRYEKESLYRLVQTGDYGSLPGVVENKLMQDLTLRLSDLQSSYAQLSSTFSPTYPKLKQLQSQIDETKAMLTRERKRVAERITNDYQAAVHREALVREAFQQQEGQANEVAGKAVQYNILKREVDTNKQLYEGLLQRLKEAGVSAGLKASNIRIVDAAVTPTKPIKPRVLMNLSLALVLGLAFGVGLAFLREHLDNTFKTAEDIEKFMQLPALAMIPALESLNGHSKGGIYGLSIRPKPAKTANGNGHLAPQAASCYRIDQVGPEYSALSEAFRSLRTSVLLSSADRPPRSLLITSAQPSEGKTTVATNLAISLAQLGQRVLLIDGDLRRPTIHKALGIKDAAGIVSYLTGQQDWRGTVITTAVPSLDVIPCGLIPPNPAELLSSERMRLLIRQATAQYTMVLIDSPPMLSVADGRVLATQVDGVVLVVKGNTTPRDLGRRAQFYARDVGANVIGVVLNNVDLRRGEYYYYRSYQYGYSSEPAEGDSKN